MTRRHGWIFAWACPLLACHSGTCSPSAAPDPAAQALADGVISDAAPAGTVPFIAADPPASAGAAVDQTQAAPLSAADHNPFGVLRPIEDIAKESVGRAAARDGVTTAFVRIPDGGRPQILVTSKDRSSARVVVDLATTKAESGGIPLTKSGGVFGLAFSPDAKQLYFQADGWGTSFALYAVEVKSTAVRFVSDTNGYQVIDACNDARLLGKLVLLEHSYFDPLPQSAVDWYFLRDDHGKRLGIVGPSQKNVQRLLAKRCGSGKAPPDPPRAKQTDKLPLSKLKCGSLRVTPNPIELLDGTTLDFVRVDNLEEAKTNPDSRPIVTDLEGAEQLVSHECP